MPDPVRLIQENVQEFVALNIHHHSLNKLNSFSCGGLKGFSQHGKKRGELVSGKQTLGWESGKVATDKVDVRS